MSSHTLITKEEADTLISARKSRIHEVTLSLDLHITTSLVYVSAHGFSFQGISYILPEKTKADTIYVWNHEESSFTPVEFFEGGLAKLIPTPWGPPTFLIDGVKMLPAAKVSPLDDARKRVLLVQPQGKRILDTCGGLGYFAHWAMELGAREIISYEKHAGVRQLRKINPWTPQDDARLKLNSESFIEALPHLQTESFDAILHDPPRMTQRNREGFLDSTYNQFVRLLRAGGLLYHYTGHTYRHSQQRDVRQEVGKRLQRHGFTVRIVDEGVLATK